MAESSVDSSQVVFRIQCIGRVRGLPVVDEDVVFKTQGLAERSDMNIAPLEDDVPSVLYHLLVRQ